MIISAFIFGGIPADAVRKAFSEAEVYVSERLLSEYRDVPLELKAKGKINRQQLKTLVAGIASFVMKSKIIHPDKKLTICRDLKDNMVLECCLEARAKFLITSDKDFFDIKDLPFPIKIITPRKYLEVG